MAVLEFMVSSLEVMKVAQICDDLQSKAFYGQLNLLDTLPIYLNTKKSHIKLTRISSPCCSEIDIVLLINHVSYYFLFSSVRLRNWVGPLHQLKEAASNKVTGIVVLLRQRQPKWLSIITASKFFWFGIHSKQQDTYCCS